MALYSLWRRTEVRHEDYDRYIADAKHTHVYTEVEGAFNLLIVIILSSPKEIYETAVKTLINTLTKTESAKISLKQKM